MAKKLRIRSYQPGDEAEIVRLFKERYGAFTGPTRLTVTRWREMHEQGWWNRPSVREDPESFRVAVRGERIIGYVAFHQRTHDPGHAYLQELCVAQVADAREVAHRLLDDVVRILRERGVDEITWMLSPRDPWASGLAEGAGFLELLREPTVFMARLVSPDALFRELAGRLGRRLKAGPFSTWSGTVLFDLRDEHSAIACVAGKVEVLPEPPAEPTVKVRTGQETLCRMVLGALRAEEAYQQDRLMVRPLEIAVGTGRRRALELLDVLFPQNRWSLPRGHSW